MQPWIVLGNFAKQNNSNKTKHCNLIFYPGCLPARLNRVRVDGEVQA